MHRLWLGIVRGVELLTVVLFAALTLDVLWGVVSRYVFGQQSRWTEELAIALLTWVSLLGAALVFREKGHLGVDYFVGKMDPSAQRVAGFVADLAVLLFAGFILVFGGCMLVSETLQAGQLTPAMGWKVGYLYSVVPLSGLLVMGFTIEQMFRKELTTNEHQ